MGVLEGLRERLDCGIHTVTLDNAAGGQKFARDKLGAQYALRSIIHIIDLLVQSTVPKHSLQGVFYRQLSNIFYQVSTRHPAPWRRFMFFFFSPWRWNGYFPGSQNGFVFFLCVPCILGQRAD